VGSLATVGVPELEVAASGLDVPGSLIGKVGIPKAFGRRTWLVMDPSPTKEDPCETKGPKRSSRGRLACSLNGPSDPTGRLRTTPGFDIVAATTSGRRYPWRHPDGKRCSPRSGRLRDKRVDQRLETFARKQIAAVSQSYDGKGKAADHKSQSFSPGVRQSSEFSHVSTSALT
jgi:hypothetical protein